jgi:hypothetical protein
MPIWEKRRIQWQEKEVWQKLQERQEIHKEEALWTSSCWSRMELKWWEFWVRKWWLGNHRHQGQSFIKQVSLSKPPQAYLSYGKGKQKKVKSNASSSPKYSTSNEDTLSSDDNIFSDDDDSLLSEFEKNPNVMIKGLMKQVEVRDELLKQ